MYLVQVEIKSVPKVIFIWIINFSNIVKFISLVKHGRNKKFVSFIVVHCPDS